MSHVVWLDGALVDPDTAALPITDPGVRWGDGLFETMRAEHGRVPLLDRHLARVVASTRALGLDPVPTDADMRRGVDAVVAELDDTLHRVRITVTARPTLLVEATPYEQADPNSGVTVVALPNTWWPGDKIHEHKTLSYAEHRLAHRRAVAQGANHALLVDDRGRLGESDAANVFVVIADTVITPPIEGILGGIARDLLLDAAAAAGITVEVRHLDEAEWRGADEMLLSNGLAGIIPVLAIDGTPVGDGTVGPMTTRLRAVFDRAGGRP